jgi:hypothetical protein
VGGRHDRNRRPTKAERKEQARVERERIQREIAARSRNRKIGLGLVSVAAIGAITAAVLAGGGSGENLPSPEDLLARAGVAAQRAGCDAVATTPNYQPEDADGVHIGRDPRFLTAPGLDTYPTVPPASGPHNDLTLGRGSYSDPPPMDQALHSLQHGAAVIWYDPTAPRSVIDRITAFYEQDNDVGQGHVIVAPYDYPDQGEAGRLPAGVQMALAAWHRLQTCTAPDLAVAFDFTSQYAAPPAAGRSYIGEATEAGAGI